MRILFFGRHYAYFRNFESVLDQLAANGHAIHLAVERGESLGGLQMVQALAEKYAHVTHGEAPSRDPNEDWSWVAARLRLGLDYLRYQHPFFGGAPKLRERARHRAPGLFVALGDSVRRARVRDGVARCIRAVEHAVPEEPSIRRYIQEQRPDVVLVTPLVDLGSSQVDYLRVARRLRIPTGACVWSWDHLSSKALIRDSPDRLFVWNHIQRQEAEALHGIPAKDVVVTGAQCFDWWFDRQPSRGRDAFCRQIGLPADQPMLVYVCSALFAGSPVEAQFVTRWIGQLRQGDSAALRACGILVRPHPSRLAEWKGVDLSGLGPVTVWGGNPVNAQARADYFDSLYYAAAVTGLNTSAFIEAAIVGRPVHTLLLPEFAHNQTGTVHFNYLLEAGGGLLIVGRDFPEHLRQLDSSLSTPPRDLVPFVREFVRPNGVALAATPLFVRHVEEMAGMSVPAPAADPLAPLWRRVARALARARGSQRLERWLCSDREREMAIVAEQEARARAALQEKRAQRAQLRAEQQQHKVARAQRWAAKHAGREKRDLATRNGNADRPDAPAPHAIRNSGSS